jgi:hypothetical protein
MTKLKPFTMINSSRSADATTMVTTKLDATAVSRVLLFPVHPGILTGHALVSDPAGIIIITDSSEYENTVYRLDFLRNDLFRWDTLGKLQEPAFYLSGQVSKSGIRVKKKQKNGKDFEPLFRHSSSWRHFHRLQQT